MKNKILQIVFLLIFLAFPVSSEALNQTTSPQPDLSFGSAGLITLHGGINVSEKYDIRYGTKIDFPNGNIFLSSYNKSTDGRFILETRRVDPTGKLDPTFGNKGNITPKSDRTCTILSPNGNIIIVGTAGPKESYIYDNSELSLWRYDANGKPDKAFGKKGKATFRDKKASDYFPISAAIDPSGNIVISGFYTISHVGIFQAVWRFKSNGSIDSAFADNGCYRLADVRGIKRIDHSFTSLAVDKNGKILIAGVTTTDHGGFNYTGDLTIWRLDHNGKPDQTFADRGKITVRSTIDPDANWATDIRLDSNQNIYAIGQIHPAGSLLAAERFPCLWRFGPNGERDRSFGKEGLTPCDNLNATFKSFAFDKEGNIIIVGYIVNPSDPNDKSNSPQSGSVAALWKYTGTGQSEQTFGENGIYLFNAGSNIDSKGYKVEIDKNNRIVVCGYIESESHQNITGLSRFDQ